MGFFPYASGIPPQASLTASWPKPGTTWHYLVRNVRMDRSHETCSKTRNTIFITAVFPLLKCTLPLSSTDGWLQDIMLKVGQQYWGFGEFSVLQQSPCSDRSSVPLSENTSAISKLIGWKSHLPLAAKDDVAMETASTVINHRLSGR